MQITINVRQQTRKCPGKLNIEKRSNPNKSTYICILLIIGGSDLHELDLHGHVDGEEHLDGVCLPQDQGILPGEAWSGVPSGGHEMGSQVIGQLRSRDINTEFSLVRDEMTDEHMTTALCMNELSGCQKYSMGPNFIYFGAQK